MQYDAVLGVTILVGGHCSRGITEVDEASHVKNKRNDSIVIFA